MKEGLLLVLSGPSGVGKGTIFQEVCKKIPSLKKSVSVTTRPPRAYEIDGTHYFFKSEREYREMIAKGEFLETAEVYCNYYGTPKKPVFDMLEKGDDVIFEVDTLGAKQIKKAYGDAVLIFLMPPDFEELERRLRTRGTDSEDAIKRRIGSARRELKEYANYDYIVFNDTLDYAVNEVINIINAERCATRRNEYRINKLLGGN